MNDHGVVQVKKLPSNNQQRPVDTGDRCYGILRMRISISGASFINSTSFKGSVSP